MCSMEPRKRTGSWSEAQFASVSKRLRSYDYGVEAEKLHLEDLRGFLLGKRDFLLRLLENPNLLEHDTFTDLLWAVFHLVEELEARHSLDGLPAADLDHLSGDLKRVYTHLLAQWVAYLQHLRSDYPYLFSLAVRTNPLNPDARVELG